MSVTDQETFAETGGTIQNGEPRDTCNIGSKTHDDDKHNKDTKHNTSRLFQKGMARCK